jgi:hypothetical protein
MFGQGLHLWVTVYLAKPRYSGYLGRVSSLNRAWFLSTASIDPDGQPVAHGVEQLARMIFKQPGAYPRQDIQISAWIKNG